jgi:hypothetical protein
MTSITTAGCESIGTWLLARTDELIECVRNQSIIRYAETPS